MDLSRSRAAPEKILEKKKYFGFLHFNGIRNNDATFWKHPGGDVMMYCDRSSSCSSSELQKEKFRQSWMLVDYYIRMPWDLTRAWGTSKVRSGGTGHPLMVLGAWVVAPNNTNASHNMVLKTKMMTKLGDTNHTRNRTTYRNKF